ncbi:MULTISPECIES: hypothetical protein [Acinetobacter]|jgi:hypothetical protein|uniref:hypothetical protein n=1 Tax=Acinetobacter TaxID=469 RepID=UPI0004DA3646|nr:MULTISPECIES: hypothetical protein [Acinetobacter]KEC82420.1 hypothetical protein DT74_02875 [Acinetobacter sp. ETR1]MBJ9909501.1 hypothetical protein [Acinetobacter bereziniae]MBJ9931206.1 hypothetical protein [Acinetobacter bereziniae]
MNRKNIVELVGIYIILTGLSYAFYVVIVAAKANDSVASSLLSWSATMFATVALLYTYANWREQESIKLLSVLSHQCMDKIDILIRTNDKLGSNIINILNDNKIDSYELYEDFKIQCSELHNLLLKISSGIDSNSDELNSLIMDYISKIENIKSITNNTLNFFDNLNDEQKSSFRINTVNLASSLFSNLNLVKKELKPYLFFDKKY